MQVALHLGRVSNRDSLVATQCPLCAVQRASKTPISSRGEIPCGRCGQSQGRIWKQGVKLNPNNGACFESKELTGASSTCSIAVVDGDFEEPHVIEQSHAFSIGNSAVLAVNAVHIHSGRPQWDFEGAVLPHFFEGALVNVGNEVAKGVYIQDNALDVVLTDQWALPCAFDPPLCRTANDSGDTTLDQMAGYLDEYVAFRKGQDIAFGGHSDVVDGIWCAVRDQGEHTVIQPDIKLSFEYFQMARQNVTNTVGLSGADTERSMSFTLSQWGKSKPTEPLLMQ